MEFGIRNDKITKALLRTTIIKALDDIERDPKRSVRNLVDLGLNFAEGCNQREIFDITQHYLSNENSAYYRLAENIVKEIDHKKLTAYGINFGYNGCTSGARVLREKQVELGCHIPFLIAFSVRDAEDALTVSEIGSAIEQGMALGIYIYAVICSSDKYADLIDMAARFPDCAFIFFVSPSRLTREVISRISELDNIVTSVRYDGMTDGCHDAIRALREQGCITVAHFEYAPENINEILSNAVIDYFTGTGAIAGILYPKAGCDPTARQLIGDYTAETVRSQQYPIFMFEADKDSDKIDKMFSGAECFVHFIGGGKALYTTEKKVLEDAALKDHTLVDILKRMKY